MKSSGAEWFQRFYRWLSAVLVISFVIIGAGILLKILMPDPWPISGATRWLMGGLILAYGIARLIMLIVRFKKQKNKQATFDRM